MITSEGKNHIRRYLAGYVPVMVQSVAFGIGNRAESLSDTALHLETAQSQINLTTYDFATNKLVYKSPIPDEYEGMIYEVGLYSMASDPNSTEFSSRNLTTFDSATEEWVNAVDDTFAVFVSTNTRVGADSLSATPALSTTYTAALRNLELDLSGYSASDGLSFAYNVGNANTSNIRIRFLTDTSNYYEFSLGAQTAGYKITQVLKGSAVVTGVPSWENITQIHILTTSGAAGASAVSFDAIRIEDKDTINLDYILVARKVLSAPVTKIDGMAQDIEFSLDVTL